MLLVSNTYLAPESTFRRSMSSSFMQSAAFSSEKTKGFFTKSTFVLMISGKYSTNSARSHPRCWTTSDAISTFISSPAAVARFSNIAINFCLNFSIPIVKFFHDALRVSMNSTIVFPLTLLSCWNMSAWYAKRKTEWLFSRLDTISFFSLDCWKFIIFAAKLHTVRCVNLSLLVCILNLA